MKFSPPVSPKDKFDRVASVQTSSIKVTKDVSKTKGVTAAVT